MIRNLIHIVLTCTAVLAATAEGSAQNREVKEIPAGSYHSVLPEVIGEPVMVSAFRLDETAVTNGDYLKFLRQNPEWMQSRIPAVFAGPSYLGHWDGDLQLNKDESLNEPVTRVSWFAANAYCGWKGGRLPTLHEWEYAAQAMDFDSAKDADRFSYDLIGWYSAVDAEQTGTVGSTGIENRYGVRDLFGLVMEWVEDFKPPVGEDISLDCGTVGRMQGDSSIYSYAMSIRFITRMSFDPASTTGMLGFRCAYDALPAMN
jgi:formylglycine-generating enzyme required for sulfatase activity